MPQPLLVLTNFPNLASARALARGLVQEKLAACATILPAVQSIYRWQDAIEETEEVAILIKTSEACYPQLEAAIKLVHPYAVPEIIGLPIVAGLPAYLDWVAAQTSKDLKI